MPGYDLGTARGIIEMQYNGRAVKQAEDDLTGLEKGSGKTDSAMKKVGNTTGVAGLAIAAGLGLAVKSAADFEQKMSGIAAVSGANGKQLDALRGKALQLGKDTQFSAGEAASAIEELIKAGLSVPDVLNGAADAAVNLAAAGGISIPEAATIAANSMNQFNLSAKDLNGVVDNIAGAANASAIDVSQFGQSLQQVGAVAHLAGVDFHDTATAIAIMGNAGITGSDAGTSLKTMFQRLQPQTKKAATEMMRLGLITKDGDNKFYDAQGNLKKMSDVAQILQNSLKGMTQQQKQAALQTLFGSDAIRGAAILANAGSKGFDKMAKSMGKVSAADVAKKRMDNLKGSFEQLKGSLETAGIAIGTALLPPLRSLVDMLTSVTNAFLNLSPGVQKTVVFIIAAVGAILLIIAAIMKVTIFVKEFVVALNILKLAFAETWIAALGPVALVIAAIAAVIVIVILLWKHSETFRTIVTAAWNAVKAAVLAVVNWFKGLPGVFVGVWNAIKSGMAALVSWITGHWRLLISIFLGPLGIIIALVTKFWPQITAAFRAGINFIKGIWSGFWSSGFGRLVKNAFALVLAIIQLGWVIAKGMFLAGLLGIKAIVTAVWNAIKAAFRAAMNVIVGIVRAGVGFIVGIYRRQIQIILAVTRAIWNAVMGVVRAVWGRIGGTVTAGAQRALGAVRAAWGAVRGATVTAWNAVVGAIRTAIGRFMALVNGIKGKVLGALSGAASWLFHAGQQIIQGLIDGISSMVGKVTDKIKSVTGAIKGFLPGSPVKEGPLKVLNRGHSGKQIVQMIIDGIDAMAKPLSDAMANATAAGVAPVTSYATPAVNPSASRQRASRGGGRRRLRMVDGELRLHESGRAFIRGVAEEAIDDNSDYADTLRRMG